ncbi:MAG: type IX secretion system outer membrane channel protein PorV [Capnocytophaga sp.]|nr:type IX secretion system outer membrane channel protein PorV [Capnocytophaga sp.]
MKKIGLLTFIVLSVSVQAQDNPISTAVPFQTLRSDARSNALGNTAVATQADVYSQLKNASKYVFLEQDLAIAYTHTRFANSAFSDMSDNSLHLVYRRNHRSAWGGSINYYDMGKLLLKDGLGNTIGEGNPYDLSADLSYSLLLSETFSMGITGRFLNTRLEGIQYRSIGTALAFDLSGFYRSAEGQFGSFGLVKRLGFSLQNIGSKMKFNNDENEQFLPTSLRIGGGITLSKADLHAFDLSAEIGKILVPEQQANGTLSSKSAFSGMFDGFGNAAWLYSGGLAYTYHQAFTLRTGYYGESEQAGGRNFVGLGLGVRLGKFDFDTSYTFGLESVPHPLDNNLRLSLAFRIN